ncbi:MAG: hypothetical protein NT050_10955 [Verrucomicrobia bacterium]|nr:hypothetical protein [Verrucomicrobiota bacterium]
MSARWDDRGRVIKPGTTEGEWKFHIEPSGILKRRVGWIRVTGRSGGSH